MKKYLKKISQIEKDKLKIEESNKIKLNFITLCCRNINKNKMICKLNKKDIDINYCMGECEYFNKHKVNAKI